jgi:hypothetical protein
MRINVKVFGLTVLAVELELPPALEIEDEEEIDGDSRLTTSDHSFGFAPDPVFPLFDWGDDEDVQADA